ncbi:MAG: hypothetical protein QM661_13730 [Solimonas sp.]
MTKAVRHPATGLAGWWLRWRFHLSAPLVLLMLLAFLPQYLQRNSSVRLARAGLGEGTVREYVVGPWPLRLAEWDAKPPERHEGLYEKTFALALCKACLEQVKAAYLHVGKPRSLRAAGVLFDGAPYRRFATLAIPADLAPDAELWLTLEGWDGTVHRVGIPLAEVAPATAGWARGRGGKR